NNLKHKEGVISMARANDPNSASSQFFIMVGDGDWLDGQYAAFGKVTSGLEIVKKIAKDAKPIDNNGTIPEEEQPIIEKIIVVK
ncbi:MAG: peptidylprolyl isomerase, partial [Erysipelotrichaceae bacterium]|nr:peptidylprolyl isomerase [Erysipelotrichaceae bacterium]